MLFPKGLPKGSLFRGMVAVQDGDDLSHRDTVKMTTMHVAPLSKLTRLKEVNATIAQMVNLARKRLSEPRQTCCGRERNQQLHERAAEREREGTRRQGPPW